MILFNFTPLNIDYKIIVIIGISFFTFSTISYTSEIYQGKMEACKSFLVFGIYISYFPKIIAGPIARPNDIINQLVEEKNFDNIQISKSFQLILIGLFKKIVIANRIATVLKPFYREPIGYGIIASLTYIILYSIQIYADFSGYSEMVRGISLLFGIKIKPNFLQPYLSLNIKDFWRRWHVSLSDWIRDYIYIPLGGNRKGKNRSYINVIITMFLCGLWHGADITFIIWGLIHGIALVFYNIFHDILKGKNKIENQETPPNIKSYQKMKNGLWGFFSWLFTFGLVSLAWVFFRAPDLSTAMLIFAELINFAFILKYEMLLLLIYFPIMVILDIVQKKHTKHAFISDYHWLIQSVVYTSMIIYILYFLFTNDTPFIYGGF
ncbi:MAG: MBOAT family O-acyltransferase [Promethearchaeota archaeon]